MFHYSDVKVIHFIIACNVKVTSIIMCNVSHNVS